MSSLITSLEILIKNEAYYLIKDMEFLHNFSVLCSRHGETFEKFKVFEHRRKPKHTETKNLVPTCSERVLNDVAN